MAAAAAVARAEEERVVEPLRVVCARFSGHCINGGNKLFTLGGSY